MKPQAKIFLFVWFYIGWFGCIFLAKQNLSPIAFLFAVVSFAFGLRIGIMSLKKVLFLIVLGFLGYAFDAFLLWLKLISFPSLNLYFPPLWLLAMWLLFASTLPLMESFFSKKLYLAAISGAIFGPLSYYAGSSFQVLFFTSPFSLVASILFWGVSFPLMIYFQRKIT